MEKGLVETELKPHITSLSIDGRCSMENQQITGNTEGENSRFGLGLTCLKMIFEENVERKGSKWGTWKGMVVLFGL